MMDMNCKLWLLFMPWLSLFVFILMFLFLFYISCALCLSTFLFVFHVGRPLFHQPSLAHSLCRTTVDVVACPFAFPLPPSPFLTFLRPRLFIQNSPPHLQTCPPHPFSPLRPCAHLSYLRGTHSLGVSPRPWRQSYPFSRPLLCPGPGSGGPAYLPCSPPL